MRVFCEWLLLLLALCGSTSGNHWPLRGKAAAYSLISSGVRSQTELVLGWETIKEDSAEEGHGEPPLPLAHRFHSSLPCNLIEGRLSQIDAGIGQVFGVNSSNVAFTIIEYGLLHYPGNLKAVSPGPNGIWAVKTNNRAARWLRDNWVEIGGQLTQIDAGGSHIVAGVINDTVHCLPKSKIIYADVNQEVEWDHIEGEMKHIACGRWGCWAVNGKGQAYFRHGITEDSCVGSSWTEEGKGFSKIEAGTEGGVYGLSNDHQIYHRVGITKQQPAGTGWALVELEPPLQAIKDMSYDLRTLWIVTPDFRIFKCLISNKHYEEQ